MRLEIVSTGEGPPCEDWLCEFCIDNVADFQRVKDKAFICARCAAEGTEPW